jgi:hypothetical protein
MHPCAETSRKASAGVDTAARSVSLVCQNSPNSASSSRPVCDASGRASFVSPADEHDRVIASPIAPVVAEMTIGFIASRSYAPHCAGPVLRRHSDRAASRVPGESGRPQNAPSAQDGLCGSGAGTLAEQGVPPPVKGARLVLSCLFASSPLVAVRGGSRRFSVCTLWLNGASSIVGRGSWPRSSSFPPSLKTSPFKPTSKPINAWEFVHDGVELLDPVVGAHRLSARNTVAVDPARLARVDELNVG